MEVHYGRKIDPAKLNGHRHVYEAMEKAAPLVIVEAYRMAKAYGTKLVFELDGKVAYADPEKYTLDEIRQGLWKQDPDVFTPPGYMTAKASH